MQLILDGNASANAKGTFGLLAPSYAESRLELNGNTLTLVGTNKFWMCKELDIGLRSGVELYLVNYHIS